MSGPPPPIAASRREAILAAALDLFRRWGFHSVGIDEIGTSAGISGPGVYRHFPSKSSLLVALFENLSERMLVACDEIQKLDCPPAEAQTVVHAALGAINSIAFHDPGLPPEAMEVLLGDAARVVLARGI